MTLKLYLYNIEWKSGRSWLISMKSLPKIYPIDLCILISHRIYRKQ